MSEQNNNRTKWLHVRLKPEEFEKINRHFRKTTCRKLSDYARKILLGKPLIGITRDQSLDDYMAEAIRLKSELNRIGNNFNQAVKKLNAFQDFFEIKIWLSVYDSSRKIVMRKLDEIKSKINQFSDSWSQE